MRLIKVAVGNTSPKVGAFDAHADTIIEILQEMSPEGRDVAVFGENCLSGYCVEDSVHWPTFLRAQAAALQMILDYIDEPAFDHMVIVLGLAVYLDGNIYNCAAVIQSGRLIGLVPKTALPDYNIFYEGRTITPGALGMDERVVLPRFDPLPNGEPQQIPIGDLIFEADFGTYAVEVCEDIWDPDGPMRRRCYSGAELVLSINASPYRFGVHQTRREMVSQRAADNCATIVYANLLGGQDGLIFDGGGFVNQCGRMMLDVTRGTPGGSHWESQVVDLDRVRRMRTQNTTWRRASQRYLQAHPRVRCIRPDSSHITTAPDRRHTYPIPASGNFFLDFPTPSTLSPRDLYHEELGMIVGLGLDGYCEGAEFKGWLIALSGGKDSWVVLDFVHQLESERADRMGLTGEARAQFLHERIWCVSMPTKYNSDETKNIARRLAEQYGVRFSERPIQDAVEDERQAQMELMETDTLSDMVEQNIQARVRGARMWNLSNQTGFLWLQTSNMSERAANYATVGGDMMGALCPIGNLPKTVIIDRLKWRAQQTGWQVLRDLLESKASAELKEDQTDEDDLMPFPVLDACFYLFVGEKMDAAEVLQVIREMWTDEELRQMYAKYEPGMLLMWVKRFVRRFFTGIYKWVQTPISLHLGTLDLERERALQLPVISDFTWATEGQPEEETA